MLRRLGAALLCTAVSIALVTTTAAQETALQKKAADLRERMNKGTVGVISGGVDGTYVRIAGDLASVLDNEEDIRILPMIGKGSIQNIRDILYLRGIDVGIVQSDVLAYLKRKRLHASIETRIHYITKLYNEEFHLLAGRGIDSVRDLVGKKVNFGNEGSGTYMTASIVFDSLGIEVTPQTFDQAMALDKVRKGDIAAMVYIVGKPARLFSDIANPGGIRLISLPHTPEILKIYPPSRLTRADYPNLIAEGQSVRTLAVGAVMAVYNWEEKNARYAKVARFVEAFFDRFDEFQKPPRHPKWRDVSLTAELPGWTRFKAADDWLKRAEVASQPQKLEQAFARFLAEEAPSLGGVDSLDEAKDSLFKQFLLWQAKQEAQ